MKSLFSAAEKRQGAFYKNWTKSTKNRLNCLRFDSESEQTSAESARDNLLFQAEEPTLKRHDYKTDNYLSNDFLWSLSWLMCPDSSFKASFLNLHKKLLKPFYFLPFHIAGAITRLPFHLAFESTLHIVCTRMTGCLWGVSGQFPKSVWTALFLQSLLTAGPCSESCVALGPRMVKVTTVEEHFVWLLSPL